MLALGAAGCFGGAAALQHLEAGRADVRGPLDPQLVQRLATRPVWLLGTGADALAVVLQTFALHVGSVLLVQGLLVLGLPVAVVVSARLGRRRLHRSERRGLLLCTAGLVLALPVAATADPVAGADTTPALVAAAGVGAATVLLLVVAGRRPSAGPALTGAAAGVVIGAANVLLAYCAVHGDRLRSLLTGPAPYLALLAGGLGLVLAQAAFQRGALGAPLAALSLTEPVTSVVLAVSVLGQVVGHAVLPLSLCGVGVALAAAGVVDLARVPHPRPLATAAGAG